MASVEFDVRDEGLKFDSFPTNRVNQTQFTDIRKLRTVHYKRVFQEEIPQGAERSVPSIVGFVWNTSFNSFRDLNDLVDRGDRTKGQFYSRQQIVVVSDEQDRLRAAMRVADNVSSSRLRKTNPSVIDNVVGSAEVIGKLLVPLGRLVQHRHWLIEEVVHDGTLPGIQHLLAGVELETRSHNPKQMVSAWPFSEELSYRRDLTSWGLQVVPNEEPIPVPAFGAQEPIAMLEHWRGERLGDVENLIFGIPGVVDGVAAAMGTMQR